MAPWRGLTRRATICGLSAFSFTSCLRAATPTPRIASLNWALSETLYAMKIRPVCAVEIPGYNRMVGYPTTPPGLTDVGLQSDPNLELLASLSPDLILIQQWQNALRPSLSRFGRVEAFTLYTRGGDPFARAEETLERMGKLADAPDAATAALAKANATLSDCRTRLSTYDGRPIYLVQALSPTNLVVFAKGSLFDSVMRRLGLANAWSAPPNLLWGSTRIGVDALENPEARIIWISSPDSTASDPLFRSALWQFLPQVKARRAHGLPLIWGFGGLPTAERFGRLVTEALTTDKKT